MLAPPGAPPSAQVHPPASRASARRHRERPPPSTPLMLWERSLSLQVGMHAARQCAGQSQFVLASGLGDRLLCPAAGQNGLRGVRFQGAGGGGKEGGPDGRRAAHGPNPRTNSLAVVPQSRLKSLSVLGHKQTRLKGRAEVGRVLEWGMAASPWQAEAITAMALLLPQRGCSPDCAWLPLSGGLCAISFPAWHGILSLVCPAPALACWCLLGACRPCCRGPLVCPGACPACCWWWWW